MASLSSSSSSPLLLLLLSSLLLILCLSASGSALLFDGDRMTSPAPSEPHFTDCVSSDQMTFRCWWSPGAYHNLSSAGDLRVFYLKKELFTTEWKWRECPEYIHSNRECFFDSNHTALWITYCVQLRSQDITFHNEDVCFKVENIVRPDPPVSLNWTLLNVSPSGLSYDIVVNWEPPPSADVGMGWMRIEYEMLYREKNSTNWEALEVQGLTRQTIYGLVIGKEYEVHIHSKMPGFAKYGEFSNSIFIQVMDSIPAETTVPLTLVLVFGITGTVILIMLVVISQQHKLMMVLLPPVPAPKIKGIDSELLKKGKLDELNFILSGGSMGGLPPYAPDFYQDELWVEFIEVDAEDTDGEEKEDNRGSDTQRLLSPPQPISHHMNINGCSNALSYPVDDSGQTICYDPALSDQDNLMLMSTFLPGQTEDEDVSFSVVQSAPSSERGQDPLVQTGGQQTWVNTDFYAQVSNVMPSGGVVLSPGQQPRIQEGTLAKESEQLKKGGESEEKQKEMQFQLLVVDPEGNGYTTESNVRQSTTPPTSLVPGEEYQTIDPRQVETKPVTTAEDNQSPYFVPDSPETQFFAPVADYTVVQELDSHHSLLLNPPHQSTPTCLPQHPLKTPMPIGYVTPDLLGKFSP